MRRIRRSRQKSRRAILAETATRGAALVAVSLRASPRPLAKSLGNICANPHVGLLFITMEDKPKRLRVNGRAQVFLDDPLMVQFEGAQALVRVTPVDIFPNCPRNIPRMQVVEESPYVPRCGIERVEPGWKKLGHFADAVPPRRA